jgi:hypothetical protein
MQDIVIGRTSMAARNFLMRFKGKERSLAREWFMKRRKNALKIFEGAIGLDS